MTVPLQEVELLPGVGAWFTGRPASPVSAQPMVGRAGNLSHRRPHEPARLAADRRSAFERMGIDPGEVVWMRQVHGGSVAVVDADTPRGAEIRGVDALVTDRVGRPLAVQVADCVPVLLASEAGPVGVAHAGRQGVIEDVVPAALEELRRQGAAPETVHAVIGPAIGGCCYEVPQDLADQVAADHPAAAARTTWNTPALDLPRAVSAQLEAAGVVHVQRVASCTRCGDGWFSHRADPAAGRQVGVIVRHEAVHVDGEEAA